MKDRTFLVVTSTSRTGGKSDSRNRLGLCDQFLQIPRIRVQLQQRRFRRKINFVPRMLTCREEVLEAVHAVVREKGRNVFTADEIVNRLRDSGSAFAESTIRTHVTSRCCRNALKNYVVTYQDFERIKRGIYRLCLLPRI
jgi:hypothetical protein